MKLTDEEIKMAKSWMLNNCYPFCNSFEYLKNQDQLGMVIEGYRDQLGIKVTSGIQNAIEPKPDQFIAGEPEHDWKDIQECLHKASQKALEFVLRNREMLLRSWIAETGLHPSECVLVEQDMGNGVKRVSVEKKEDREHLFPAQGKVKEWHCRVCGYGPFRTFANASEICFTCEQEEKAK